MFSGQKFLLLDCQTTGLSSKDDEILEIGWCFPDHKSAIETALLKPSQPKEISSTVWEMTGLSRKDLESAKDPKEVWRNLCKETKKARYAVVHYAQFEKPFVEALHKKVFRRKTLPWTLLCSYHLAKRLYPELPSHTLRALSGHFGLIIPETHRCHENILATQKIWEKLLERLDELGVRSTKQFVKWYENPPTVQRKAKKLPRKYLLSSEVRLKLPDKPGVYEMIASDGQILYIGKATSLKSRVNSYFRTRRSERTMLHELMTQVADLKVIQTESALEAALLENDRIKEVRPRYNTSLKAKSSPPLFMSNDLVDYSLKADRSYPWGPFFSPFAFESLEILYLLSEGSFEQIAPHYLKHPAEAMKEKLDEVLSTLGCSGKTRLELLRAGKKLALTPEPEEEVQASVVRKLRRAPEALHSAHWICWLTESRLSWRVGDGWRYIEFKDGKLVEQGFETEVRPFIRKRVPFAERQKRLDRKTFDRMKILLSEVSRLKKKGVPFVLQLSSTRSYSSDSPKFGEIL